MTAERLVEAIRRFDPDGEGVARVRQAARHNQLAQQDMGRCLLSVGWKAVSVGRLGARLYTRETVEHDCGDVVEWFDSLDRPNRAVLRLLGDCK